MEKNGYAHATARPGKTGLSGQITTAETLALWDPLVDLRCRSLGHALALDDNMQLAAHALRAATALGTRDYCGFGSDLHRRAPTCSAALRFDFWTLPFVLWLAGLDSLSQARLSLLALGGAFSSALSSDSPSFLLSDRFALGQTRSWTIFSLNP